jgi:hypothetical protein
LDLEARKSQVNPLKIIMHIQFLCIKYNLDTTGVPLFYGGPALTYTKTDVSAAWERGTQNLEKYKPPPNDLKNWWCDFPGIVSSHSHKLHMPPFVKAENGTHKTV